MTYDDLNGPDLSADRWRFLEVPLGPEQTWRYADPAARTEVGAGAVSVRIDAFTRSHAEVQILDNPKHLLVSTETFDLTGGPRTFAVEMASENIGATGEDYRDGFAAFNVLDMSTAQVFDLIATSRHAYAIHERLFVPGVVPAAEAFTHVVHAPLAGIDIKPGEFHRYAVTIDRAAGTAGWHVDDVPVYTTRAPQLPESVQIGFGIITLHPIEDGRSTSLRGQGLHASWRDFTVA
ncbi:DUF6081 family protein [Nocardia implantans]|uniref:DUF6081 family protein n=1 Tax=Nocardia implantans TaxID=3108168 RepID=A0ABU6AYS4_9NOCA|nr:MULTISPECIES: DUF6081 family protein [unclassified Nocardia]MBF6194298.1 hypothetical protein [Nocardia beijingensis]MEA3529906.1 DUF6081 family protein [Nocardia sp. CDC192]MEB3512616.1 DUF6081 family protein [Nocardia sp. CDC186]